jgi:hypothetical protein
VTFSRDVAIADLRAITVGELLDLLRPTAANGTLDPERWIDLRSDECPVNPRLLWAAIKRGELAGSRVGNATLVKWRELDRWLQLQRVKPIAKKTVNRLPSVPSSIAHLVGRTGSDD